MDWIECIPGRLLRAVRREAGFTLIEVVMAMAIFAIVATSLIGVITSATAADGLSRQKTIALELAQQQLEYVRQLSYKDVCISGGNPACPVTTPATTGVTPTLQKRVMGLWYTITTSIRWVNDPVSTGVATGANYKRVRVTITRSSDGKQLDREYAYVSNPCRNIDCTATTSTGGINYGIINVTVYDYGYTTATNPSTTVLQNAQVDLWDGPSGYSSDVTDETGLVTFPMLTPNPVDSGGNLLPTGATAYYDILTSLYGYRELREDLPPGTVPSGTGAGPATTAHVQIGPGQTLAKYIHLYKPATVTVNVTDLGGYTGTVYVDIGGTPSQSPNRCAQEFPVQMTNGSASLTIGPGWSNTLIGSGQTMCQNGPSTGEQPVSGAIYQVGARNSTNTLMASAVSHSVPNNYPTDLSSVFSLTFKSVTATNSCTVTVQKSGTNIPNARVDVLNTGGVPVQVYQTGTTNSSGKVTFILPATTGYDIKFWGILNGVALTGGASGVSVPTTGTCAFNVGPS